MSRYKAYPEYRDSGVEWLGEAPAQWATIPVGRLYVRTKRTGHADKELLSVYRDHGVVPTSSRDDNNNKPSEDLTAYQLVEPNNLVMNKMKAWQGSIAISEHEGIVSPAYFVYQPNAEMFDVAVPKYIHYLLRHPIYIAQYLRQSKGIRVNQWDLDPDEFKKIELLLPRKEEQKKIIAFLDHEIAKIDALIERQQRLIELLKEKRQAVISHAVTKGLDPNAPLKDSGVEWADTVPAHWRVSKLSYHASVSNGATPSRDNLLFWENGTIGWLNSSKVNDEVIEEADQFITELAFLKTSVKPVEKGDLVMAITGEGQTRGRVAICNISATINQHLAAISIYDSRLNYQFLCLWLEGNYERIRYESEGAGSTKGAITCSEIGAFPVVVPPAEEQDAIIDYVNKRKREFDRLVHKAISAIELMQERRTALISAAVTGKIDVRDWQPAAA